MQQTVSVTVILDLVNYLTERGANRSSLFHLLNTTEEHVNNPQNRLPSTVCGILWQFGEVLLQDKCLGLHVGERKSPAALGLISPLIQSCPDVWTAVTKTSDYMNVISDVHQILPSKTGTKFTIFFEPNEEWKEQHPHAFFHVMASSLGYTVKTISGLTGKNIPPTKVFVTDSLDPGCQQEYERVLNCRVCIGTHYGIEYPVSVSELPITTRNIELMGVIEMHIQGILQRQSGTETFSSKVKKVIVRNFAQHFPTIGEVADYFALSIRNLQRKLKEENTHFQALLSDIKKELAEDYLKNKALSISDIAYMLGYAEPAVFSRAYKKWTGLPPENARLSPASAPAAKDVAEANRSSSDVYA